jgi:acyl-CoA synthetase (AMP-forming)/AMP-acid ligase II
MENTNWILKRLTHFQNTIAFIWKDKQLSYGELVIVIEHWLNYFKENNISKGEVVAICGDYSPKSCALLLALFINNNIVLPITSSSLENKQKHINLAQVRYIIEINENDEFTLHKNFFETTHPLLLQLQYQGSPGLILFSSGSTGECKAMVLNVDKLLCKFKDIKKSYRTLVFLLLDHIGGINTLLHVLTQGGTLITVQNRDPGTICQSIEFYQIELLPTTPTFLNMMLISGLHEQYNLSSLKLITYGTESMPISTLTKLNEIFTNIKFKQTYGLSELGILPTKSESANSPWFLLGDDKVKYKIVNGILLIRCDSAMLGYLNAPNAFDDEGWFITSDVVETKIIGGQEYLRVLGRETEIINVGGEKVYPNEVENVLLQVPNIVDVVVSNKKNPVTGQIVVATVRLNQPEDPSQLYRKIREFCKDKIESYKIPLLINITQENLYNFRYKKIRAKLKNHINS